jgi:hypothetical protein
MRRGLLSKKAAEHLLVSHSLIMIIINMDQTPVYFSMNAKRTLELVGTKTIHVRTSTHDTKRATVAVTITADGTVLPLMVVFKGKPNGRIAKTEFAAYPVPHRYRCQENAWMDEVFMLAWVDEILQPYVETAPDDVIPLLILDSYQCHMMASVVEKVQELGVEVKHIPGECTSLCQPVVIGFNKPFKDQLRKLWISRMITEGVIELSNKEKCFDVGLRRDGGNEQGGHNYKERVAKNGLRMVR